MRKVINLLKKAKSWIIPANPKYYDIINCFAATDTIIFNQQSNVSPQDLVYIYVASPYSAILYKCQVLEINIPYEYTAKNVSMTHVMKIKLLERYDKDKYPLAKLKDYGITTIRAKRSMPKKLSDKINK